MAKLPSNPKSLIPFIALESATPTSVTSLLQHVPVYGAREWRRLVANTIGAIHQVPHVFKSKALPKLDLKDIEAYFGRSSSGSTIAGHNLYGRFRAGLERGHSFGMVFATTDIDATLHFERFGISLINRLKDVDGLCIANKSLAAHGKVGTTEPGYLYMTFGFEEGDEHARMLSQREIDDAVAGMLADLREADAAPSKSVHEAARDGISLASKDPPAKPGALEREPLKAAVL
jgi:hypothetical protein